MAEAGPERAALALIEAMDGSERKLLLDHLAQDYPDVVEAGANWLAGFHEQQASAAGRSPGVTSTTGAGGAAPRLANAVNHRSTVRHRRTRVTAVAAGARHRRDSCGQRRVGAPFGLVGAVVAAWPAVAVVGSYKLLMMVKSPGRRPPQPLSSRQRPVSHP